MTPQPDPTPNDSRPEPVPRPLFEAALRVLRGGATRDDYYIVYSACPPGEPTEHDAAERTIRRAAACGVREEE